MFTAVCYHLEKCFVGLKDLTFDVKDDDSDNVGADQAPDLGFQPTEPIDAVLLLPFRVP